MNTSIHDGVERCWWCGDDPLYVQYHDMEWGVPVDGDQRLFEKLCLEGFQAGLSWITILRKREDFRRVFKDFDFEQVARFNSRHVQRLLKDASIVRHQGKIESTINNAKRVIELIDQCGSLAAFLWKFEPAENSACNSMDSIPAKTPESVQMSKELKRLGWSFVGPTTCYSLMQAMGMVNDHIDRCHRWRNVDQLRRKFKRPI